jgi:hypothetical protein
MKLYPYETDFIAIEKNHEERLIYPLNIKISWPWPITGNFSEFSEG